MPVLLITYDLNRPGQDYPGLLEEIRSTSWARLSESSYAVDTSESASAVYDRVSAWIESMTQEATENEAEQGDSDA